MRELGDGAFSGTLAADSGNVVTLVRDLYNVSTKLIHFNWYTHTHTHTHTHQIYTHKDQCIKAMFE